MRALSRKRLGEGMHTMRAVDIIRKKRDGSPLSRGEIEAFVRAATDGSWPDYQLSALLMAIVLRGMSQRVVDIGQG